VSGGLLACPHVMQILHNCNYLLHYPSYAQLFTVLFAHALGGPAQNKGQKMILKFSSSIAFILIGAVMVSASVVIGNFVGAIAFGLMTILAVSVLFID